MTQNTDNTTNSLKLRTITAEDIYSNDNLIFNIGRKYDFSTEQCEDLLQNVAIKCCCGMKPVIYDPSKGKLSTFLHTITEHMACDMYRRDKIQHPYENMDVEDIAKARETMDCYDYKAPIDLCIKEEKRTILNQMLEELKKHFDSELAYKAFLMATFNDDGKTQKEIAEELGVKECVVSNSVKRGKDRLEKIAKKYRLEN